MSELDPNSTGSARAPIALTEIGLARIIHALDPSFQAAVLESMPLSRLWVIADQLGIELTPKFEGIDPTPPFQGKVVGA